MQHPSDTGAVDPRSGKVTSGCWPSHLSDVRPPDADPAEGLAVTTLVNHCSCKLRSIALMSKVSYMLATSSPYVIFIA